jgi:hypothetical protein
LLNAISVPCGRDFRVIFEGQNVIFAGLMHIDGAFAAFSASIAYFGGNLRFPKRAISLFALAGGPAAGRMTRGMMSPQSGV